MSFTNFFREGAMNVSTILITLFILGLILFLIAFIKDYIHFKKSKLKEVEGNTFILIFTGFIVNFLDTLGIGGFATMTAMVKEFKLTDDKVIPGTLMTAQCLPAAIEGIIFIKDVRVDYFTLSSMIISAVLGSLIGVKIVSRLERHKVQRYMSYALISVLVLMILQKFNLIPSGGDAIGFSGIKLAIAVFGNFILGALMTLGVGMYAPCMALVCAMGLNPLAAFPIIMGSCGILMPVAAIKFIESGAYNRKTTLIVGIIGTIGVIVGFTLIKTLPIAKLTWLVMIIITYTSIKLYKSSKSQVID